MGIILSLFKSGKSRSRQRRFAAALQEFGTKPDFWAESMTLAIDKRAKRLLLLDRDRDTYRIVDAREVLEWRTVPGSTVMMFLVADIDAPRPAVDFASRAERDLWFARVTAFIAHACPRPRPNFKKQA